MEKDWKKNGQRMDKEWSKNGHRTDTEWPQTGHRKSTESMQKQFPGKHKKQKKRRMVLDPPSKRPSVTPNIG